MPEIEIALLRYAAEPVFPAGRVLLRRQALPSRELSPGAEHGRLRHGRGEGRGRYGIDAGNEDSNFAIGFTL